MAEEAAVRELVRELGGFTLAVEQVAVFLGLHGEITPSAFLAGLRQKGLPSADALPAKHVAVGEQMLHQDKQLALILQATLARLNEPALTALVRVAAAAGYGPLALAAGIDPGPASRNGPARAG